MDNIYFKYVEDILNKIDNQEKITHKEMSYIENALKMYSLYECISNETLNIGNTNLFDLKYSQFKNNKF